MFKGINKEILPDLVKYIDNSKSNAYWKNHENPTNWMSTNKKVKNNDEILTTKIRTILNKICKDNFDESLRELYAIKFESKQEFNILSELLFKKIITERNNIPIYINLTKSLATHHIIYEEKRINFKELILAKCQSSFEVINKLQLVDGNLENEVFKYKDEVITYTKYIGELYNNKLIGNKILSYCLSTLFIKFDNNSVTAYTAEIICALFGTTMANLKIINESEYDLYMDLLIKLKDSDKITKLEKFAIMDILDSVKN